MRAAKLIAVAAALAVVAALIPSTFGTAPQPASATTVGSSFQAGNIISDALFFDGNAMNASQVQSFLNAHVGACAAGYTCLKSYTQATTSKAGESGRCNAYSGGGTESAATIIAKVGAACGVSQKALLVLLQKEQSLVTDSSPELTQYRSATGYGCPDTAACDSTYYGFFNQVWMAALQFKRYAANPTGWNHIAGRVNNVRFSPTASCGSSAVFIQNQATAGLYNYTPYQPDALALTNLYGKGGSCSSYGNRNFWRMFTDWFGSTTAGSSLVRTTANATVYLTSGKNKYPIASQDILTALAPLGNVAFVSQNYLDGFTTLQTAGRVLRSDDGTIYFYDSGIKLPFSSCQQVIDYGGSCSTNGFVQLTATQLSAFATGPAMRAVLGTTSGARYYITAGTKREILDNASQAAAGIVSGYNVLGDSAVSALPFGQPIVRDSVFAAKKGASGYVLLAGGSKYAVDASLQSAVGLPSRSVGSLQGASLAKIPDGAAAFSGVVRAAGAGANQLLGDGGRYELAAGSAGEKAPFTATSKAFVDSYALKGSIVSGATIKAPSSGTVYVVMPTQLLPIASWEGLIALAGGGTPKIQSVPDRLVAALPKGPVALNTATLVRTPEDATVWLVNGVTSKVALSNFIFTTEAGITAWSFTTKARLDAYPRETKLLGFGLTCGSTNYVSAGGSVHKVAPAQLALFPFTFVSLDTYTCALLKKGPDANAFILVPNGTLYQLVGGVKRPIASMARFAQLNPGGGWLSVASQFAAAIPTGPSA